MNLIRKIKRKLGIRNNYETWEDSIPSEIKFWDDYFRTGGLEWKDSFEARFDKDLKLQERPSQLIKETCSKIVNILDVGAGPLTFLGKKLEDYELNIEAIDPLADEYDKILNKYGYKSPVQTKKLTAEDVHKKYKENSKDLIFARNCIDHSFNPELAILNMIKVVKSDHYVLLEHRPNEAITEKYRGLHQWNFGFNEDLDFIIGNKISEVNFTEKYKDICEVKTEHIKDSKDGEWLINYILKK